MYTVLISMCHWRKVKSPTTSVLWPHWRVLNMPLISRPSRWCSCPTWDGPMEIKTWNTHCAPSPMSWLNCWTGIGNVWCTVFFSFFLYLYYIYSLLYCNFCFLLQLFVYTFYSIQTILSSVCLSVCECGVVLLIYKYILSPVNNI